MSLLTIDQGNSVCKLTLFRDGELIECECLPGQLSIETLSALLEVREHLADVDGAVFCSVAKVDVRLVESLRMLFGDDHLLVVTRNTELPISIDYKGRDTLGTDRIAGAVGAAWRYKGCNMLVVDAGTCITMDIVDQTATFRGGNISPGVQMRFKSLHQYTGRLPMTESDGNVPAFGYDTATAIRAGVVGGVKAEILQAAHMARKLYGADRVVLTGGDGQKISGWLRNELPKDMRILSEPHLLALGLYRIYKHNENL